MLIEIDTDKIHGLQNTEESKRDIINKYINLGYIMSFTTNWIYEFSWTNKITDSSHIMNKH